MTTPVSTRLTSLQQAVVDALRAGPASTVELAERVGEPYGAALQRVSGLYARRLVRRYQRPSRYRPLVPEWVWVLEEES